jgi:hypothetical protein
LERRLQAAASFVSTLQSPEGGVPNQREPTYPMSNFSIGDKVVCVDDKFPPDISKLYDALPVKDSTYVVRDIRLGINLTMEGDVSVLLIGLVNPKADSKAGLERGFRADRFRPLEELRNEQKASKPEEEKKELEQPVES